MTHKQMSSNGGKAGKGSEAKHAAAIKANAARWKNHRKPKRVLVKPNDALCDGGTQSAELKP